MQKFAVLVDCVWNTIRMVWSACIKFLFVAKPLQWLIETQQIESSDPAFLDWQGSDIAVICWITDQQENLTGDIGMQVGQKRGGSKIDLCILQIFVVSKKDLSHSWLKLLGNFPL